MISKVEGNRSSVPPTDHVIINRKVISRNLSLQCPPPSISYAGILRFVHQSNRAVADTVEKEAQQRRRKQVQTGSADTTHLATLTSFTSTLRSSGWRSSS